MPGHRRGYPLINELNEHPFRHELYLDETKTADDRYALERAGLVAPGAQCTYVITAVDRYIVKSPNSTTRRKVEQRHE
jgi:hypothetical protein